MYYITPEGVKKNPILTDMILTDMNEFEETIGFETERLSNILLSNDDIIKNSDDEYNPIIWSRNNNSNRLKNIDSYSIGLLAPYVSLEGYLNIRFTDMFAYDYLKMLYHTDWHGTLNVVDPLTSTRQLADKRQRGQITIHEILNISNKKMYGPDVINHFLKNLIIFNSDTEYMEFIRGIIDTTFNPVRESDLIDIPLAGSGLNIELLRLIFRRMNIFTKYDKSGMLTIIHSDNHYMNLSHRHTNIDYFIRYPNIKNNTSIPKCIKKIDNEFIDIPIFKSSSRPIVDFDRIL